MKYKRFSRRTVMDIAKIIRNSPMSVSARATLSRSMVNYFEGIDPMVDKKVFMQIANGGLEFDVHTEWCSELKEKNDDQA